MGLRKHDTIPEWVTHVALASGDVVRAGPKKDVLSAVGESSVFMSAAQPEAEAQSVRNNKSTGKIVLETKNLTVAYHERKVTLRLHF